MHVGRPWKQSPPKGAFDVIVIGSGLGGLTAAAALAMQAGRRVLVLERHYRVGGYTHVFTRPGYEWDVGVHYVGQVGEQGALRPLFDRLSDGKLQWAPLPEVYDAIELGGRRYELHAGRERFVAHLAERFPGQGPTLSRYVKLISDTARRAQLGLLGRAGPPPTTQRPRGAPRTTLEVLRELTDDEELIGVLTGQYGDYGLPPARSDFAMHAALVEHYLDGAWYPVGGASQLARTFAAGIERAGGHLATHAEVTSLVVEGGAAVGVRLGTGEEVRAPVVISAVGARNTFERLLPEAHRPPELVEALRRVQPSSSYLCLYLGLKHTDAELGLTGTNLWLYEDAHHDERVRRYAEDPEAPFPMLYLSFPSAKDPDFARRHPGRATIDVITGAPWSWFERWKDTRWQRRGADYDAFKERLKLRLLEAVYRRLPQLRGKVDHAELSTPLSAAHFSGHPFGELYGLESSAERFALPLRAQTAVPGLVLSGVDVTTCGVGGAALSGALAASAVVGRDLLWALLKR